MKWANIICVPKLVRKSQFFRDYTYTLGLRRKKKNISKGRLTQHLNSQCIVGVLMKAWQMDIYRLHKQAITVVRVFETSFDWSLSKLEFEEEWRESLQAQRPFVEWEILLIFWAIKSVNYSSVMSTGESSWNSQIWIRSYVSWMLRIRQHLVFSWFVYYLKKNLRCWNLKATVIRSLNMKQLEADLSIKLNLSVKGISD